MQNILITITITICPFKMKSMHHLMKISSVNMARRRKRVNSDHVKLPGATNWKKLSAKLDAEKNCIIKKKVKKLHPVETSFDSPRLSKVTSISDRSQIKPLDNKRKRKTKPLIIDKLGNELSNNITHRLALDCEMVGSGKDGSENQLARVSIVNVYGDIVYDKIVLPREVVTDYRSAITGLNKEIISIKGVSFKTVQGEVAEMIRDKVVIGHDIKHDFDALEFSHPKPMIRDTAKYKPFKTLSKGNTPSLKKLCREILKKSIQEGAHDSIEDARCALQLYRMHRTTWERSLKRFKKKSKNIPSVDDEDEVSNADGSESL